VLIDIQTESSLYKNIRSMSSTSQGADLFWVEKLLPQRPDLAGPANQAGELDYIQVSPQDG
jgi:hypothetical protein